MKILIQSINFLPDLTGIGKYTGETAHWLSESGHEIRIITAPPYYPEWKVGSGYSPYKYKIEKKVRITVFRCPIFTPSQPTGLKRIFHLGSFAISSIPVLAWNAFWRPEVIIVIEPPLFAAPGILAVSRLSRAKAWLHIQDFEIDAAFDLGILPSYFRRWAVRFERLLMSNFSRVSTISAKMMQKLWDKGVTPKKTVLFPNWVDGREIFPLKNVSSMREELQIPHDSIVALYSGNMGEKQGLEIVIEVAKNIQDNTKIVLLMCGTGSAYKRLREAANGLENIRWIPLQPIERLNDLLNMADIHLLPQRADAADLVMPSKLTGMMASGRPVLATAFEGTQIAEALTASGKIVPPGDVNAFGNALRDLAQNKELRERLGAEARRYAVEHWDKENVLRRFEQSLKDLLYGFDDLAERPVHELPTEGAGEITQEITKRAG